MLLKISSTAHEYWIMLFAFIHNKKAKPPRLRLVVAAGDALKRSN